MNPECMHAVYSSPGPNGRGGSIIGRGAAKVSDRLDPDLFESVSSLLIGIPVLH